MDLAVCSSTHDRTTVPSVAAVSQQLRSLDIGKLDARISANARFQVRSVWKRALAEGVNRESLQRACGISSTFNEFASPACPHGQDCNDGNPIGKSARLLQTEKRAIEHPNLRTF